MVSFTKKRKRTAILLSLSILAAVSFVYFVFIKLDTSTYPIDSAKINPLLANEGEISLLIIGDNIEYELLLKELNEKNVYPKFTHMRAEDGNLEELNKKSPFLKIEKKPTYYVFDSKGVIYKTSQYDDLVNFLIEFY